MKNKYVAFPLVFIIFFCSILKLNAQVNTYVFSVSSGIYTPLVGGTTVAPFAVGSWDDGMSNTITLPFTFTYNGEARTQIKVNANGWALFNVANTTNSYLPISVVTASINNVISACGRDLQANAGTGNIVTGTVGSAPNRTFVIEWKSARAHNSTGQNLNFQIRLNEQGGVAANQNVQVAFGTMVGTTASTRQVGLKGSTNADFNNRTSTTTWAGATAGGTNTATLTLSNTVFPTSGLTYTWTPPIYPTCSGTPAPGNTQSSLGSAGCNGAAITLSLSNQTTLNGQSNLSYQWQTSPDGFTWSNASGTSTNKTYVTTFSATTIYRCNVTCTNGGAVGTSTPITVTLNPFYLCYCANIPSAAVDEEIFNVSIGTLNNTSNCAVVAPGAGSILNRYSNYGSVSPSGNITTTVNRLTANPISLNLASCGGAYGSAAKVYIDNNRDGDYSDADEMVYATPDHTSSAAGQVFNGTVTLPYTGVETDGLTGLRVVYFETTAAAITSACTPAASYGEVEDYVISVVTPPECAGTPAAANALSSSATVCSDANFNLSLSTAYIGLGFSYQWSSSPDNSSWTPIGGATSSVLTTSQTATTYYRCVISCENSGLNTTSASVSVGMKPFLNCYCVNIPLSASEEEIFNVTIGTLNNTSNCADVAPGAGSILKRYGNYGSLSPTGNLTTTVTRLTPTPISLNLASCEGAYGSAAKVYIDNNRDGDYSDADEMVYATPDHTSSAAGQVFNGTINLPYTGAETDGLTGMRVVYFETTGASITNPCVAASSWGEVEDYVITLATPPECSGTPAMSNALSSRATVCSGENFNLSLSTDYYGVGFSYQWYGSTDNNLWNAIVGATSSSLTTSQTAATYFRCVTTCSQSGETRTSASVLVGMVPFLNCYCSSAATNTADEDILNVTLGALNNSSTCSSTGGPGSITQMYSNYTGLAPVSIDKGIPITFSARVAGCSFSTYISQIGVFIDGNQDGDFTDAGELVLQQNNFQSANIPGALVSETINLPLTFLDGITGMRVITIESTSTLPMNPCGSYTWGETEDYLINLTAPCSGTTATISNTTPLTFCAGSNVVLNANTGTGFTYQWKLNGTNISGATAASYTASASGSYTVTVSQNGGCDSTSTAKVVTVNPLPTVSSTVTPASGNTCTGGSATLSGTGAVSYAWTGGVTNNVSFVPTATSTYTVTGTDANGCVNTATRSITVNAIPTTPGTITGPTMICGLTTATYSITAVAGATSYTWTLPTGITGTSTTNTINVAINTSLFTTGNIGVRANSTYCTSALRTLTVAKIPATPTTLTGTTVTCGITSATYTASASNGATSYTWALPTGFTGSSTTTTLLASINNTLFTTGNVSVTANNSCGSSTAKTLAVSKVPFTPGTISGPTITCGLTTATYSVTQGTGATSYSWTLPTGITGTSTTNSIVVSINNTLFTGGNISVIANNACGSSPAKTLAVSKFLAIPGTITGPSLICGLTTGTYSITAISGATSYTWTLPSGLTGTSTTNSITASINPALFTSGNVTVTANNACGASPVKTLALTKIPASPTTLSGSSFICGLTSTTYTATAVTGATSYTWTLPAGLTGTSTTNTITVAVNPALFVSGSIGLTANNTCGSSAIKTLALTKIPSTPTAISGLATGVCAGSTQTYSCTPMANSSSYTWAVPAGSVINSGQGTASISVSLPTPFTSGTISVTANSACGSSTAKTLSIRSTPTTPGAITGQSSNLCGGGTFSYSITAVAGATGYNWLVPAGCTIASGANTNAITVTVPSSFASGNISVSSSNACGAGTSSTLALTAVPSTFATITGPASACANQTGLVFSTTPVFGSSQFTWTVPSGAIITSGQGTANITVTWGAAAGSVSVVAFNSCGTGLSKTKSLTLATCRLGDEISLEETSENNAWSLFPNPTSDKVNIHFTEFDSSKKYNLTVTNALGQLVYNSSINQQTTIIELQSFAKPGMYFVHLIDGQNNVMETKKLIVN